MHPRHDRLILSKGHGSTQVDGVQFDANGILDSVGGCVLVNFPTRFSSRY